MSQMIRTLNSFCPHCETEAECQVLSRPVSIEFQGKTYHTTEEFARCLSCGKDFDVLGLRDPLKAVYEAYRQERGFPTGTQIAELREKLHQSPAQFAAMLNTSKTTVMLYERGALPSEEHGKALMALCGAHGILSVRQAQPVNRLELADWGNSAPQADWFSRLTGQFAKCASDAPDACPESDYLLTAA